MRVGPGAPVAKAEYPEDPRGPDEVASVEVTANEPSTPGKKKKKKKSKKRSIKSMVTVHDRTQIEAVFDYLILKTKDDTHYDKRGHLRYKVEAFFFFPPQFGLTPSTYPKERFYSDVRPLLRFREPRLGFKKMHGLKPGGDSPLLFLEQHVADLRRNAGSAMECDAISEVRVFACSLVGNFLKNIDRSRRRFDKLKRAADVDDAEVQEQFIRMTRLLTKMHDTLIEYREIVSDAATLPDDVGVALRTELKLIDEYCYYRLRDGVAFLLLVAGEFRGEVNLSAVREFNDSAKHLLAYHDDYASSSGYALIKKDSTESLKERYMRRRGELKRRIWGALFLELRNVPLFAFRQQVGPMLAAGLAAAWAVGFQILLVRRAMVNERTADFLGLSGIFFLAIAVLSYIVKDRIKEIGRSYFRSGLFRRMPDHSERIRYEPRPGDVRHVGELTEVARFERPNELPEDIMRIRCAHGAVESTASNETALVLHYTKEVRLARNIKILDRYPLRAVHDILRFNIDSCLPRLGEPIRAMNIVDERMHIQAVGFPKVYYLDLALRYSRLKGDGTQIESGIDFYRLVLDKTGLLRVERLT